MIRPPASLSAVASLLRHVDSLQSIRSQWLRLAEAADEFRRIVALEVLFTWLDVAGDLWIAGDEATPQDERLDAAKRLASTRFSHPLPRRRREFHRKALDQAVAERVDSLGTDPASVWRQTTAGALVIALAEARRPQPRVWLKIRGDGRWVDNPPDGIVPRSLPVHHYDFWLRGCVAREVLNDLLPDWREREAQAKPGLSFEPLQRPEGEDRDGGELPSLTLVELRELEAAGDMAEERILSLSVDELLAALPEVEANLLRLVRDGYSIAEAARQMGRTPGSARTMLHRRRHRLEESGDLL